MNLETQIMEMFTPGVFLGGLDIQNQLPIRPNWPPLKEALARLVAEGRLLHLQSGGYTLVQQVFPASPRNGWNLTALGLPPEETPVLFTVLGSTPTVLMGARYEDRFYTDTDADGYPQQEVPFWVTLPKAPHLEPAIATADLDEHLTALLYDLIAGVSGFSEQKLIEVAQKCWIAPSKEPAVSAAHIKRLLQVMKKKGGIIQRVPGVWDLNM